jgi:hypothetical protein
MRGADLEVAREAAQVVAQGAVRGRAAIEEDREIRTEERREAPIRERLEAREPLTTRPREAFSNWLSMPRRNNQAKKPMPTSEPRKAMTPGLARRQPPMLSS